MSKKNIYISLIVFGVILAIIGAYNAGKGKSGAYILSATGGALIGFFAFQLNNLNKE